GLNLAEDRAANPRDDITSALMAAQIDHGTGPHRLPSNELGSSFLLPAAAGHEPTGNAIPHGRPAPTKQPEQRAPAQAGSGAVTACRGWRSARSWGGPCPSSTAGGRPWTMPRSAVKR